MAKRKMTSPEAVTVKGQRMKPMYVRNEITNRTNKNLWVTFEKSNPTNALVYSMRYDRDEVRNAARKVFGTDIANVRSQRVGNYRKNYM